ncbi:hypothetical protein SASPL_122387 [Salvia splendens]|uniref:Diacylglycerol O-acyltransferase n=1 Tax=Salvia splendens TaxID=180675 RepID=A0A8X8ZS70_SALSN|nr:wax ester synthase/diacylglycerol acyltransferase 3-like [Salvia splendens]KAG6414988.1 hypothetical protein SASPL_122387 [Salvia splendens]
MAESVDRDQPLTPAGRLFLQPQMNQIISAAITVEFPIDIDSFRAQVQSSIMFKHPRFCSLMVRDSAGREHWRRTAVDIDQHLIVHRQPLADDPSISGDDAVDEFIADLSVSSPLSADKPLWEIHLLLANKTLIFRVHHALGDGISLMSLLLSCCRRADDPSRMPSIGGVGAAASGQGTRRMNLWTIVLAVWYTLLYVVEFILRSAWRRDRTTAVSGGAGVELWPRKLTTARLRLDDMKLVKGAVANATINDVLFGVLTCGMSRYLDMRSPKALPEGLRLTGLAMVNLRPQSGLQDISKLMDGDSGTRWGNKFGMLLLPVYFHRGGSDPIQFVKRSKAMIDSKKLSLEGPFSYSIGNLLMSLFGPKVACLLNYRILCNTTFTISNVVGPTERILIAGNPVKRIRVTSSSLPHAITMHMVSYAGMVDLQILVAKDIIPDPKTLAKCFEDALREMKEAVEATNN